MSNPKESTTLWTPEVASSFDPAAEAVIEQGDCLDILRKLPGGFAKLIITSPPYNIGKSYEKATSLNQYLDSLDPILEQVTKVLSPEGSLCWQVGNYVAAGEVFPLDIYFYQRLKAKGLKLRNRIVWHFEHGLHACKRFSGRYETLLWFTKGDQYTFNLDPVRVPSKYPGKTHFKGEKRGQPSGNPLGKNPSDIWHIVIQDWETALWDIPNVKANHPEKTLHPCQFPIELVERCVLALTDEGDWVLDPFSGVGSALLAALKNKRRAFGCEKEEELRFRCQAADRRSALGRTPLPPTREARASADRPGEGRSDSDGMEKYGGEGLRLAARYPFKNGLEEITRRYPHLLAEVKDAIAAVDASEARTKLSQEKTKVGRTLYSPAALNRAFKRELGPKGWRNQKIDCEYPTTHYLEEYKIRSSLKGAFRDMDFVKDRLGVEVQFGKYSFMVYNVCAKMTIFRNLNFIDCGIEIVPAKALALEMSSGVSYFEQFVWDLESRGVADIDIPVLILGVDA